MKIVTGKVRFSFVHIMEPSSMTEGGMKKYNVSLIVQKSDSVTCAKINKAIDSLKEEAREKYKGKKNLQDGLPKGFWVPFRDGDEEKPDSESYEDAMFLSAKSKKRPGVVDADLEPMLDLNDLYSGCYGRASISFFLYDVDLSKGIGVGLNNLQKLEDGDPLKGGGGSSAADDFGSDNDSMM